MPLSEQRSLEMLFVRLTDAFPDLDETEIREAIAQSVDELAQARLRQFVPLLVEKQARTAGGDRRLSRSALGQRPATTEHR